MTCAPFACAECSASTCRYEKDAAELCTFASQTCSWDVYCAHLELEAAFEDITDIHSFCFELHARQAQQAQPDMYWSNWLSPTSLVDHGWCCWCMTTPCILHQGCSVPVKAAEALKWSAYFCISSAYKRQCSLLPINDLIYSCFLQALSVMKQCACLTLWTLTMVSKLDVSACCTFAKISLSWHSCVVCLARAYSWLKIWMLCRGLS